MLDVGMELLKGAILSGLTITIQPCYLALSEDADCRICLVSESGVLLDANGRASLFFRRPLGELIRRPYEDAFPERSRASVRAWLERVLDAERELPGGVTVTPFLLWGEHWVSRARVTDVGGGERGVLCVSRVRREPTPVERVLEMIQLSGERETALGPLSSLTDRELEVAMLIAAGMTDVEIAKQLHRSTRTVHAHRRMIGKKLGVHTRAEVLRIMTDRGMVGEVERRSPAAPTQNTIGARARDAAGERTTVGLVGTDRDLGGASGHDPSGMPSFG